MSDRATAYNSEARDGVHVNTNVSQQTSNRKRARRNTTKCPHCDQPRLATHAYCREHWNAYQRTWRKAQREELLALRKMVGTWVEPA